MFFSTLLSTLHASQQIEMVQGARAEIEFIEYLERAPPSGWLPVALRIANRTPNAREWRVRFEANDGSGADLLGNWTVHVPGNETREAQLFVAQPWFVTDASYITIRGYVSGPEVASGRFSINHTYTSRSQTPYTGMSHALASENWSRLEAELDPSSASGTGSSGPAGSTTELTGARFDPTQLPADWRTWSGFATIWLARDDWIGLTGVQRLALLRWVAQGGDLYLAGTGPGLEDLPLAGQKSGTFIQDGDDPWPLSMHGFGQIHRVPFEADNKSAPRLPIAQVATTIRSRRINSPALALLSNEIEATEAEKTLGTIRPGGLVLGLLTAVIAILLGPVNIFLLAPAPRRARLFVTVPIISLGGALALVGLILLQDGTGGHGQRGVLIALLPDRPEALVLQEQCAMTGLLVRREFTVPEDLTVVDYTQNDRVRSYGSTPRRPARGGLDRSGAQMMGDWFTSRTVHAHHLRAFVPTRAALTLTPGADGPPSVVSTCPGVLRDLIVNDAKGGKWWAAEVPPGRTVALESAGSLMIGRWREQLRRFGVSLAATIGHEEPPLSFHASADAWDESVPVPTLATIRWRKDLILVTGSIKERVQPPSSHLQ